MTDETMHKPGFVSLATAVVQEAEKHGVNMENTVWAEFLRWHKEHMTAGSRFPAHGSYIGSEENEE
jgi:hypothetical protein